MKKEKASLLSKLNLKKETVAKIKKMLPGIISTAVVLIIVLITVFQSTDGFTTIVETEPAQIVTERDYMTFTAYTLKNEKLLSSGYSGGVYYLAENAQRVNPGDELAKVYENKLDESVILSLETINRCIDILEESIDDGAMTLGESKEVTDKLSSTYYGITKAIANGNASDISAVADELLILMNKIKIYSGSNEEIKNALSEYKNKKAELEKNYSGRHELLKTDTGGYFFKSVDGYENIYSSSDMESLTYDSFFEMTSKTADTQNYVGKLLVDYKWYLVIPTVKGISDAYSVATYYDIAFPDNQNRTIEMQLDNIIYDSTGSKSIMIFACGVVDKNFDYTRIQQVSITNRNVSGYRVPKTAVCEISGHTGVYILKDGMASFRKASILYEGEEYYIISSQNSNSNNYFVYLEPNDNVITDCKNMYEGKVIGG